MSVAADLRHHSKVPHFSNARHVENHSLLMLNAMMSGTDGGL